MQGKDSPAYETSVLCKGVKERPLTALEMSSVVIYCCTLMNGLVIRSSEKICSGLEQIKRRVKALTVTLGKSGHSEAATHLHTCLPIAFEIPTFLTVEKNLKKRTGEWFEFMGALQNNDTINLAPRVFPNLSASALFQSKLESATMMASKAPVIQHLTEPLLQQA
ncbi:endogenous Bornavirus-like nucleoprotein 1 [Mastomys coucha]|uniref:endogenous Bornavirus-like nucleoprotein 1 n=1 Tax=Mastomys coucha TaxID=35658 RepID=UPI0012622FE6|nr:endogenous Bornavirus-like nucleoprotein 1 [Mastomys coucha]